MQSLHCFPPLSLILFDNVLQFVWWAVFVLWGKAFDKGSKTCVYLDLKGIPSWLCNHFYQERLINKDNVTHGHESYLSWFICLGNLLSSGIFLLFVSTDIGVVRGLHRGCRSFYSREIIKQEATKAKVNIEHGGSRCAEVCMDLICGLKIRCNGD